MGTTSSLHFVGFLALARAVADIGRNSTRRGFPSMRLALFTRSTFGFTSLDHTAGVFTQFPWCHLRHPRPASAAA